MTATLRRFVRPRRLERIAARMQDRASALYRWAMTQPDDVAARAELRAEHRRAHMLLCVAYGTLFEG